MKDFICGKMSANNGLASGPVRPIPIHLTRPHGLDSEGFRHPLSMDKPSRPNPPLWNPALDLSMAPREILSTRELNLSKKTKLTDPSTVPSTSSSPLSISSMDVHNSAIRSSETKSTGVKFSPKITASQGGMPKAPPVMGTLLYEQLHLHFPGSLENPLAVLASNGLFPTFLGVQDPILTRFSHPPGTSHPNLAMPVSDRHITLQNALSFAQSRALMERMPSSHQHNPRRTLDHLQQPHQLQLHQNQQQQHSPRSQLATPNPRHSIQRSERMVSLPNSTLSHSERHKSLHNATVPHDERPISLHNTSVLHSDRPINMHCTTVPHSDRPINLHSATQRHSERPINLHTTPLPQSDRPIHLHNTPTSHTEQHISIHSAFSNAHSRAILERISNNPMLSPVISIDNAVAHGYGRKLFPCPQCRYTTDRRNNLKRHMLTMHQTSSKMLECCGILFNTKASLREHAMIFHYHGYTCYFCGRRFCRKALLKRHLSVHNGQKDFVCNVCDYATSHKSNLERHRKVHSRQDDGKDGDDGQGYHDDDAQQYHDDVKSNGSEAFSHDDASSGDLSVCSEYDDDTDVEINVHSD